MSQSRNGTLIYFADPMCPWCWGFSETMKEIKDLYTPELGFQYVAGGLRTGDKVAPVTPDSLEYVKDHWECAMYESGQPFDLDYVDQMDFPYDTEPGCRAVVAVRSRYPGYEFEFEKRLQHAFYNRRMDPTKMDTYLRILEEMNLETNGFAEVYESEETERSLQNDFQFAANLERKILPSLVLISGGSKTLIASGFTKKEKALEKLQFVLEQKKIVVSENDTSNACEIDGEGCC